jgi:hypothetical protein
MVFLGQATGGKNQKDMASHKFWATQPVQRFGTVFDSAARIYKYSY